MNQSHRSPQQIQVLKRFLLTLLVGMLSFGIIACDSDKKSTRTTSGGNSADIEGSWSGSYKLLNLPACSGNIDVAFTQSGDSLHGTYAQTPNSGCTISRYTGSFSGAINGSSIQLIDSDGDTWVLSLRNTTVIRGEIRENGAVIATLTVNR